MKQTIYVIVNSYNDYEGCAVATDGGAFSTFERAKEKFIEYLHEIWDFRKEFYDTDEEFNEWFESCFQSKEKTVWIFDSGDSVSDISIHQTTLD
jgi:hypothetical protein